MISIGSNQTKALSAKLTSVATLTTTRIEASYALSGAYPTKHTFLEQNSPSLQEARGRSERHLQGTRSALRIAQRVSPIGLGLPFESK